MRKYIRLLAILFALPLYLNAQNDDNGPDFCNLIQEYNLNLVPVYHQMNNNNLGSLQLRIECNF